MVEDFGFRSVQCLTSLLDRAITVAHVCRC